MTDVYEKALNRLEDVIDRRVTWNDADVMAKLLRALLVERRDYGSKFTSACPDHKMRTARENAETALREFAGVDHA